MAKKKAAKLVLDDEDDEDDWDDLIEEDEIDDIIDDEEDEDLDDEEDEAGSLLERFGDEEDRVIGPAICLAAEAGIRVSGPYPADTVFVKAVAGEFDCVVAMYHDQGLIPIKLLAWRDAVNITLGLPTIRTSPDHGTAFDIAGRNRADPSSMIAAIRLALDLADRRRGGERRDRA